MTSKILAYTESSKSKIEKIKNLLQKKACDIHEIASHLFCDRSTAAKYLRYFRAQENKQVYICEYRKKIALGKIQYPCPVYKWGERKDAPKPSRETEQEKGRKCRLRVKTDPVKYEALLAKKRKERRLKKLPVMTIKNDPLLNFFFGAP